MHLSRPMAKPNPAIMSKMFVYFHGFVFQLFSRVNYKFLLFIIISWALLTFNISEMSSTEKLVSVNFEVFGKVQGVFFRKFTEKQAKMLGLRGWCMNTQNDTVKGVIEGAPLKVSEMKQWLEKTGSPHSRIDRAVFSNEKDIKKYTFESFKIKR